MPSEGPVSMISGVLFDKLVGLHTHLLFCMTLMPSRRRLREWSEILIRGHLGAFRSNKAALIVVMLLTIFDH